MTDTVIFFVGASIADFIINNFFKVANSSVTPEVFEGEICFERAYEELTCGVTSMRLDCITAAVASRSRSAAENMVLSGTVTVNGTELRKKRRYVEMRGHFNFQALGQVSD